MHGLGIAISISSVGFYDCTQCHHVLFISDFSSSFIQLRKSRWKSTQPLLTVLDDDFFFFFFLLLLGIFFLKIFYLLSLLAWPEPPAAHLFVLWLPDRHHPIDTSKGSQMDMPDGPIAGEQLPLVRFANGLFSSLIFHPIDS